jgi:hypothetical protein
LSEEEKIIMSEIDVKAYTNSQDSSSTIIGGFAAHAAVPHSGSKPQFGHLNPPEVSKTTAGETYIDCICRRDDEQNAAVGIVEIVGTQEEKPFRTLEELLIILNTAVVGAVIMWEK